ncbi:UNVERIFIED_CONTAM: hypothetical protein Slati_2523800 [Sesamum latifolium]|uniref:Uncharacterized protein n=1 Tax=Sesamum latifolium TaxID=2727402 RepID=A0AAW2WG00_9LAMI
MLVCAPACRLASPSCRHVLRKSLPIVLAKVRLVTPRQLKKYHVNTERLFGGWDYSQVRGLPR